jgi:4-hydroxy-2-oxoglutarate aldolase
MTTQLKLDGISVPAITPFNADETIAPDQMKRNLEWWNSFPIAGYLILGSTGEPFSLTADERVTIIEAARDAIPSSRFMMVGTGQQTTRETIDLTKQAAKAGADAALVVTPFYYKNAMRHSVLVDHFRAVADASPIPVLLYSVPIFTAVVIEPQTVEVLADHPNIIGMKDSNSNYNSMVSILGRVPSGFTVLNGAAAAVYGGLCVGAAGATLAVANLAPDVSSSIYSAFKDGNHDLARAFQMKLERLADRIITPYGIGGIKTAVGMRGGYGGSPRLPLPAPDSKGREVIEQVLREAELI